MALMYSECANSLHLLPASENGYDRVALGGNYQNLLETEIVDDESNFRSRLMMSHWFESTRRRNVFYVVCRHVCMSSGA